MDQYYGSRRHRKKNISSELSTSHQRAKNYANSSNQDNIRELEKEHLSAKRHGKMIKARNLAKQVNRLRNAEQDSHNYGDSDSNQDNIRELEKEYLSAKRHGKMIKARNLAKQVNRLRNAEQDSHNHGNSDLNRDNRKKLYEEYRLAKKLGNHGTVRNLKKQIAENEEMPKMEIVRKYDDDD